MTKAPPRRKAPGHRRDPDFFDRRGDYALANDSAGHRRFHWLYEDLLS